MSGSIKYLNDATQDLDSRWRFFQDGQPHPADCPCGNLESKRHGLVCYVPNGGAFVHEEGLGKFDWKRQAYLATTPGSNEHYWDVSKDRLPETPGPFYRALRISKCRAWCVHHGTNHDHSWCYPPMSEFWGGLGI